MFKVSNAVVIVFCSCIYTGIAQAIELDYTECVPENREYAAIIPKIIFSVDYTTPEYVEHGDEDEVLELADIPDMAIPITNIPANAGTKVSIVQNSAYAYNNGRGIIMSMRLKVDGGELEISPADSNERQVLIYLGTRVSRIHPIMSWRVKMMYLGRDTRTIQAQCTTFYKAANTDFNRLARDTPIITRDVFFRVFGQN